LFNQLLTSLSFKLINLQNLILAIKCPNPPPFFPPKTPQGTWNWDKAVGLTNYSTEIIYDCPDGWESWLKLIIKRHSAHFLSLSFFYPYPSFSPFGAATYFLKNKIILWLIFKFNSLNCFKYKFHVSSPNNQHSRYTNT
jgi:hypothetical protein